MNLTNKKPPGGKTNRSFHQPERQRYQHRLIGKQKPTDFIISSLSDLIALLLIITLEVALFETDSSLMDQFTRVGRKLIMTGQNTSYIIVQIDEKDFMPFLMIFLSNEKSLKCFDNF